MEKMLKQDEIDALFQAARATTPAAPQTVRRADKRRALQLAAAGQISNEQLRAISMLNDLFARNLTHNLAAWLRCQFQVNLVSAEQIPFNEFLLRIPEISYVASVRLEPLGALSVLQLDLALAPPIIDLLARRRRQGRTAAGTDRHRGVDPGSVVEIICRELTAAWQPVGLSFNFERRQMQTQVARIMSVTEKTLCLSFEIRMPQSSGLLNLAFPAVVANTILRRLTSDWGRRRRHAPETRARLEAGAGESASAALCNCPPVRLAARDLENLQPGNILRLDLSAASACGMARCGPGSCVRRSPSGMERTALRASRIFSEEDNDEDLSRLLDIAATTLFSQALAGEPELTEMESVHSRRLHGSCVSLAEISGEYRTVLRRARAEDSESRRCSARGWIRRAAWANCCARSPRLQPANCLQHPGRSAGIEAFQRVEPMKHMSPAAFSLSSPGGSWTYRCRGQLQDIGRDVQPDARCVNEVGSNL